MAKKVLPIHPDPLADVHRTCNLLLPLASARCDMVFQTSNNNSNNKKEKSRKGNTGRIYFSPLGCLARACCIDVFAQHVSSKELVSTNKHTLRTWHARVNVSNSNFFDHTRETTSFSSPILLLLFSPFSRAQTNKQD